MSTAIKSATVKTWRSTQTIRRRATSRTQVRQKKELQLVSLKKRFFSKPQKKLSSQNKIQYLLK